MTPRTGTLSCQLDLQADHHASTLVELTGLAIVLIVLYYVGGVLGWSANLNLQIGIDLLFFVYGASLASDSSPATAGGLLARHLLRILPSYWVVLSAYWLCNVHFLQLHYAASNLVVHYLGLQGAFGDASALSFAEPFCLVTMLLAFTVLYAVAWALRASPAALLLTAALFCVPLILVFSAYGQAASYRYLGRPSAGFFIGVLAGWVLKTGRIELRLGPTLALALFLLIYVSYVEGVQFLSTAAAISLAGAYVLAWKRLAPPGQRKWVISFLSFIGERWLEILLIFQPLIREYNTYLLGRWFSLGTPGGGALLLGVAAGLLVAIAAGSALRLAVGALSSLTPFSP